MSQEPRTLETRSGSIPLPAYIPVTTFGTKYPLDRLIQPYLPRLAPAVMVSYYYAQQMDRRPRLPVLIDSGGFVSLFQGARVRTRNGLGVIELERESGRETIDPMELLTFQEEHADLAFTLDFPIPPGMDRRQARRRQNLTITNAKWAIENRRRRDLPLFACIQAWDAASARDCVRALADAPFDGLAIGGLVPRARDRKLVLSIVGAVRDEAGEKPIHVFGLGHPGLVTELFKRGVDSVDSSAYVQLAAEGRLWGSPDYCRSGPSSMERLHLALCNLATATGAKLPLNAGPRAFSTLLV